MNLYHLLSEQKSIDEAPMNPTAFAGAIEQGQGAGVLVGFEFEIHVPEAAYRNTQDEPEGPITLEQVLNQLKYFKPLSGFRIYGRYGSGMSPEEFDKLFSMRQPLRGANTTRAAINEYLKTLIAPVIELFNKIPTKTRVKAKEYAIKSTRTATSRTFNPNSTDLKYQLDFASKVGKYLYWQDSHGHRGQMAQLGEDMQKITNRADDWSLFLKWLTAEYTSDLHEQLPKYFDIPDPQAVWDKLDLGYDKDDDDDFDIDDDDKNYSAAAAVLEPLIGNAMGREVTVFRSYHQQNKNLTNWYIEPDGSLTSDNDGDASAEIVSPPLPVDQAVDALKKFYALAAQHGLYTNKTTGLHINVSIPKKLDLLKLAVFLGDQYVLKYFGREANTYARSVEKHLGQEVQKNSDVDLIKLKRMADYATSGHTSSISDNGNYISFRHAGGDYLQDYQGVFNVMGRFVRAMIIASSASAYANEYRTKLAKLVQGSQTGEIQKNTSLEQVLQFLRTKGAPMATATVYTKRAKLDKAGQRGMENKNVALAPADVQVGAAAKTNLINRINKETFKQKLDTQGDDRFASMIFFPNSVYSLGQMAQAQFSDGVNAIAKESGEWESIIGYWHVEKVMLPPSDPRVQNLIKLLLRQQYAKK